ncbi:MAG: M24 family metallopeptidase, partial [Candidatus Bathyarchaeia archaeon]
AMEIYERLEAEMEGRGFGAVIAYGESCSNPNFCYLARISVPRGGLFFKALNRDPVLIVSQVDYGVASRGFPGDVITFPELVGQASSGSAADVIALSIEELLKRHGISGEVAIYAKEDFSASLRIWERLSGKGFKVIVEGYPSLLDSLRELKVRGERRRISELGRSVAKVFESIYELLGECRIKGNSLHHKGKPLRVGDLKSLAMAELVERDLIPSEGFIISAGRRASDPHYPGSKGDPIKRGDPIVIDLFPKGGDGYFYDMTRTALVGRSAEIERMHSLVVEAQGLAKDVIEDGGRAGEAMDSVCEFFERNGFETARKRADSIAIPKRGFIHSLGHGVGLSIGERPFLRRGEDYALRDGHVFTIEPGLYDPKLGGVRVEDVFIFENGKVRAATGKLFPQELLLIS